MLAERGRITVQLVYSFTILYGAASLHTKKQHIFFLCFQSSLVKLESSCTVILPPTVMSKSSTLFTCFIPTFQPILAWQTPNVHGVYLHYSNGGTAVAMWICLHLESCLQSIYLSFFVKGVIIFVNRLRLERSRNYFVNLKPRTICCTTM